MSDHSQHDDHNAESANRQIIDGGVGGSADGDHSGAPQRLSLRARFEREREARAQRHQASLANTFRNLFGPSPRR